MAGELDQEIRDLKRWLRSALIMIVVLATALALPDLALWFLGLIPLVFAWTGYRSVRARSRQRHRGPDLCVACLTPMADDQNTCSACGWTFEVA